MTTVRSPAMSGNAGTKTRFTSMHAALGLTMVLFAVGLLTGFPSLDGQPPASADDTGATATWTLWAILARNLGAALLLYAGSVTGGLATLVTMPLIGLYVGATAWIGVDAVGWGPLVGAVGWYVPFEFFGCLAAAAGGLYPLVTALSPDKTANPRWRRYLKALPRSLALLGIGVLLILVGATLEIVIIERGA